MMYHNPVMLEESLDSLCINKGGIYVDLTYGGGGHSNGILNILVKKVNYWLLIKILMLLIIKSMMIGFY